jgi:hypothetical protein
MAAILILDLRENVALHGPECLDIQFISSSIPKYNSIKSIFIFRVSIKYIIFRQTNAIEAIDPAELE